MTPFYSPGSRPFSSLSRPYLCRGRASRRECVQSPHLTLQFSGIRRYQPADCITVLFGFCNRIALPKGIWQLCSQLKIFFARIHPLLLHFSKPLLPRFLLWNSAMVKPILYFLDACFLGPSPKRPARDLAARMMESACSLVVLSEYGSRHKSRKAICSIVSICFNLVSFMRSLLSRFLLPRD